MAEIGASSAPLADQMARLDRPVPTRNCRPAHYTHLSGRSSLRSGIRRHEWSRRCGAALWRGPVLLPGDGPHRVDADYAGAGRVEQHFAADFAAPDEIAEELRLS